MRENDHFAKHFTGQKTKHFSHFSGANVEQTRILKNDKTILGRKIRQKRAWWSHKQEKNKIENKMNKITSHYNVCIRICRFATEVLLLFFAFVWMNLSFRTNICSMHANDVEHFFFRRQWHSYISRWSIEALVDSFIRKAQAHTRTSTRPYVFKTRRACVLHKTPSWCE